MFVELRYDVAIILIYCINCTNKSQTTNIFSLKLRLNSEAEKHHYQSVKCYSYYNKTTIYKYN